MKVAKMSHQSTRNDAVFYCIWWERRWRVKELIKGQEKFHSVSMLEGGGGKKGAAGWKHERAAESNVYDAFAHLPIKKRKGADKWKIIAEEESLRSREKGKSDREKEKVRVGSLRSDQPPAPVWISPFFTVCTHPSETHSPRWQMDWC